MMRILAVIAVAALAACSLDEFPEEGDGGGGGDGGTVGGTNGTGGTGGTGGTPTCDGQADCYPDAFCAFADTCVPLADTISECGYGPDVPTGSGPMLLWIEQVTEGDTTRCAKEPATCTNNGNVCWFRITAYDPDGDFPITALYPGTRFIRPADGIVVPTYNARNGVRDPVDDRFFEFEAAACYGEEVTDLGGGFVLLDLADQASNTACISFANGTAP